MSIYDLPDLRPFRTISHRIRLAGGATVTENGTLASENYIPGVSGWAIFGDGTAEFLAIALAGYLESGGDSELEPGVTLTINGDVQSGNYVASVSGWRIRGDGDAEFNDGVFRGEIDASALNISISEDDDGSIEFYDANDDLVGRLSAGSWELGDLETPGRRTTLDPVGGLRFRSETDELVGILDHHGLSVRDETTGLVVAELTRNAMRLVDVAAGDEITLSTFSDDTLFKPRYAAAMEPAPVNTTLEIPAAVLYGPNDLELGHTSAFKRGTVQSATHTPPAGWTEVIDNDYGVASTLATSLYRRAVATGTAGTVTSSQSNWDTAIGTHIIVKGVVGGTTPSVRSTSQLEQTTTDTKIVLTMNAPAGLAAGDVLLAFISMGNAVGSVPTGWVTPEGWVFLGASVGISGSGATLSTNAVGVWAKLAGASEPSTYETEINFGAGTKTVHALLVAVQNGEVIEGGPQMNVGGYNLAGPWTSYDPTLTNITKGNGTVSARYMLMGKTCFITFYLLFGSTTAITAALPTFSLPFAASALGRQDLSGSAHDVSIFDTNLLAAHIGAGASVASLISNTGWVSATIPHTWATGDLLAINGVYEIA